MSSNISTSYKVNDNSNVRKSVPIRVRAVHLAQVLSVEIDFMNTKQIPIPQLLFSNKFLASEIKKHGHQESFIITGFKDDVMQFLAKYNYISSPSSYDEVEDFEVNIMPDEFVIVNLDASDFESIKLQTAKMGIGVKHYSDYGSAYWLIGNVLNMQEWFAKFYDGEDMERYATFICR